MASPRRPALLLIIIAVLSISSAQALFAQQITRVAVLDLARVMAAFPKNAAAIKNFETRKAEVQAEIDKRAAEIRNLQARKIEAEAESDFATAQILSAQVAELTASLKEYANARQNELDLLAKALSSNASFLMKLNDTIARVAEAEGYSLVLSLKPQDQTSAIVLWNSPSVDITDKVIQALSSGN